MIDLWSLTADISQLIHSKTGVFTTNDEIGTTIYPFCFVSAKDKEILPIAGGRQISRTVELRIDCASARVRKSDAQSRLCAGVGAVILPYFKACERNFSPFDIEISDSGLSFCISFCDLPPTKIDKPRYELMDGVDFSLALGGAVGA